MQQPASSAARPLLEALDVLQAEIAQLRGRVAELEDRIGELTLPAAQPLTVKKFVKKHPSYTENALRWLLFNRHKNGLGAATIRHGRRILIDERRFFEWEAEHLEESRRPGARTSASRL